MADSGRFRPGPRPHEVIGRVLVVVSLVAGVSAMAFALSACSDDDGSGRSAATSTSVAPPPTSARRTGVTHDFVIPAGTAARLRRGEDPGVIPRRLDVRVGDRIRVRNDDTEIARLGIFDVSPGETATMNFLEETVLTGAIFGDESGGCGTPPPESKKFIINVRP